MNSTNEDTRVLSLALFIDSASSHTQKCYLVGVFVSLMGLLFNYFCYKTSRALPNQSSSTILMSYLAVWDTISMIHDGFFDMGLKLLNVNLANLNGFWCKVFYYHSWASTLNASAHLVALACDRALAIVFPIWHRKLNMTKVTNCISWRLTLFNYTIVLPNFVFFDVMDGMCLMHTSTTPNLMALYQRLINYGLFFGGPCSLILLSNLVFIYRMVRIRTNPKVTTQQYQPAVSAKDDPSDDIHRAKGNAKSTTGLKPDMDEERNRFLDDSGLDSLVTEVYCGPVNEKATALGTVLEQSDLPNTDEGQPFHDRAAKINNNINIEPKIAAAHENGSGTKLNILDTKELKATVINYDVIEYRGELKLDSWEIGPPSQRTETLRVISQTPQCDLDEADANLQQTDQAEKGIRSDVSVVAMLLVVCCSYLVLTSTAAFFNVLGHVYSSDMSVNQRMFIRSLAEIPTVMNNSLNFMFFYCSGFKFRHTFRQLFLTRRMI